MAVTYNAFGWNSNYGGSSSGIQSTSTIASSIGTLKEKELRVGAPVIAVADGWARLESCVTRGDGREELFYYEVPEERKDWLAQSADPFLASLAVLAAPMRESRVEVEGGCPELAEGMRIALAWLGHWWPDWYGEPTEIRVLDTESTRPVSQAKRVAGSFLSGGVDSLATLRCNQLDLSPSHPSRIRACIFVNRYVGSSDTTSAYRRSVVTDREPELASFAKAVNVDFVPVRTNIMAAVGPMATPAWSRAQHAAVYASAAHALGAHIDRVHIASTHQVGHLQPWGSHPLIDPYLSSGYVRLIHNGVRFDRSEKTAIVGDWPEAMDILNVCTGDTDGRGGRGCGVCEKCVRTAATLIACGNADVATHWRGSPLTPNSIYSLQVTRAGTARFWSKIAVGLQASGSPELAQAARTLVKRYQRRAVVRRIARPFRR